MTEPTWPDVPPDYATDQQFRRLRAEKILEAEIALEKERRSTKPPATSPTATMASSLDQKLHETLYTVSTGAIERARAGATFVQTAATAIGGLYTGILGVIFVSDTAVPFRGFAPTLFFAIAVAFATAYLAFVNKVQPIARPTLYGSPAEDIWQRTNFLARYARTIVLQRAPLLRAAVVSLAFGVFLLPAAVFQIPRASATTADPAPPAQIDWPTPPPDRPAALAAILYQAQIDEFVSTLDDDPTSSGPSEEDLLIVLGIVIGLLIVLSTASNQLWGDDPGQDPDGTVVVQPTVTE